MRIQPTDTLQEGIVKMVDGNPGAVTVCVELLKFNERIQPEGGKMGGMVYILALDEFEIYGSRIWMLFKDVCGEDIRKMAVVLVARSHGLITQKELDLAINGTGLKLDLDTLVETVVERFPELEVASGAGS